MDDIAILLSEPTARNLWYLLSDQERAIVKLLDENDMALMKGEKTFYTAYNLQSGKMIEKAARHKLVMTLIEQGAMVWSGSSDEPRLRVELTLLAKEAAKTHQKLH